jgi:hypothetical protein
MLRNLFETVEKGAASQDLIRAFHNTNNPHKFQKAFSYSEKSTLLVVMSTVHSWKSPWRECPPTFLQVSVQWIFLRSFGKVVIFQNTRGSSKDLHKSSARFPLDPHMISTIGLQGPLRP